MCVRARRRLNNAEPGREHLHAGGAGGASRVGGAEAAQRATEGARWRWRRRWHARPHSRAAAAQIHRLRAQIRPSQDHTWMCPGTHLLLSSQCVTQLLCETTANLFNGFVHFSHIDNVLGQNLRLMQNSIIVFYALPSKHDLSTPPCCWQASGASLVFRRRAFVRSGYFLKNVSLPWIKHLCFDAMWKIH